MPGQLRATSKPLEQFLPSHSFSPRNTRSTRKEVDREGDERLCRRSSMKFFASFRVFRGSILLMRWYSSDRSKKTKDSRLVLLSRCLMQIDVPGVRHEPNFFRMSRALNKHAF